MTTPNRQADIAKLAKMIHGIRIAMLSTVEDDGSISARPMGTQELEFDGTLWFFTQKDSHKVDDIERTSQVNVAYADAGRATYVSMRGAAELVLDKAKMKELWNPLLKAWFPEGLDDPQLALLKIDVERADYWDAPSSKMVRMAGIVKAAITGHYDQGEMGSVNLQ